MIDEIKKVISKYLEGLITEQEALSTIIDIVEDQNR